MLNNGCDDFLFGVHCVEEGDRIPPLQSYGQVLKQKNCFSGVLSDDCGASANLLDYLNSHVIPCACCFYHYYYYYQEDMFWAASLRLARYVTVTLMTFDNQSNVPSNDRLIVVLNTA